MGGGGGGVRRGERETGQIQIFLSLIYYTCGLSATVKMKSTLLHSKNTAVHINLEPLTLYFPDRCSLYKSLQMGIHTCSHECIRPSLGLCTCTYAIGSCGHCHSTVRVSTANFHFCYCVKNVCHAEISESTTNRERREQERDC